MSDTNIKNIRFIDSHYNTLFFVPDGGNVVLIYSDGEKLIRPCKYLDDYHVRIGGNVYHICEFAEKMESNGTTYAPEKPLSLPDRSYGTLTSSNELIAIEKEKGLASRFFNNADDAFAIFQLKDDEGLRNIRFEPLSWVQCIGYSVERENYDMIYTDRLIDTGSTTEKLNFLWDRFNNDLPKDFRGHSLSVSDIVALKQNGTVSFHYVDCFGFQVLSGFLHSEYYLKNAEIAMEDDYGMIDGIINNGENPTTAEVEQQAKAEQQIPLPEMTPVANAERTERRKSVLGQLSTPPVKQESHKTAPSRDTKIER